MGRVRELRPAFYAATVGHIYEAALEPRRWHDVLDALDRAYPGARITMFGHRKDRPGASLAFRKNFPDDDLRAYFEHFIKQSPYLDRVARAGTCVPQYSEVLIDDKELMKTEYYNDFVRSRRLGHYATGIVLEHTERGTTALSIADHKNDAARRAHQMHTLGILLPHLQRALQLHRAISRERTTAVAAQTLFDRWVHAAFVLDASGRLISMNAAATQLLERENSIWLDRCGNLHLSDAAESGALATTILRHARVGESLDLAAGDGVRDGFAVRRQAPKPPLQAMAWPLPAVDNASPLGGERGRVLLTLFDPLRIERTPVGWIARRYGLTQGETRLTEAIINGASLAETADQLGIQLSTARSRLKIIQSKTGCNRQVDLVRLAMSAPALGQA